MHQSVTVLFLVNNYQALDFQGPNDLLCEIVGVIELKMAPKVDWKILSTVLIWFSHC